MKGSRREFLKQLAQSGMALGALVLTACSNGENRGENGRPRGNDSSDLAEPTECDDLSGVSSEEREKRALYGYVVQTPYPDSRCDNCSLFLPPGEGGTCGGCVLFEGPVFDAGYCDYWAPDETV